MLKNYFIFQCKVMWVLVWTTLLPLHLPYSCTKAITRVLQIITYVTENTGMEVKGEQR